ncbi:redox-sensitive transcriptional activator SoxR [Dactylosporangium sp. AC04546]|uniref:redox-sensitive transcriptional activator SoxR n=1 Tax=Dactylosporangium sp. AC04546 TaxID=2862460 RepID=UPI001EE01F58|nr:redox-sensitive transcriptional activator SoxR [Dactylosporangium sp. AC04546]WVK83574.1 redox-sensitive transcriptional activator SoxR [Dactylosporangium sp. AC04546]
MPAELLTIGELSARSGVAPSALRFYEKLGLIHATRTSGNQRRYERTELRRVAFIRISAQVGIPLETIKDALASLPANRTPTKADWARLSSSWRSHLDEQIALLGRLRNTLTDCIGCGCLSLKSCSLANHADRLATKGTGPVILTTPPVSPEG